MAEAFGPLEYFKVYSTAGLSANEFNSLPSEHGSRRSKVMDTSVWEIKWGHRDDCVTAFNVSMLLAPSHLLLIFHVYIY